MRLKVSIPLWITRPNFQALISERGQSLEILANTSAVKEGKVGEAGKVLCRQSLELVGGGPSGGRIDPRLLIVADL
jgi:hypothetical protein